MCWRRPTRRAPWRKQSDARLRAGDARPLEGIALGIKDLFATKDVRTTAVLAHPRQFRADLRVDRQRAALARRRGDARQAQQRRVRHGLVERDLVLRPGDLAVAARRAPTPRSFRAARRAARPRRWRPGSASARPVPIPAARYVSPRPSPASSASSPPTAAARAGASWRTPPRSIRPGRSRARCATPRSCSPPWPDTTPRTPPRWTARCRTTRRRSANRSRA